MKITDLYIQTQDDLETAVKELGILPFFVNSVRGFSIDEHVDPGIWFTGGTATILMRDLMTDSYHTRTMCCIIL